MLSSLITDCIALDYFAPPKVYMSLICLYLCKVTPLLSYSI